MALYEFKAEDAERFARTVGTHTRTRGDELDFKTCPYCKATGRDNEYKFSINLNTGQYKCLRASCGARGNMTDLARDFDFSLGNSYDEYFKPKKQYRQLKTPKEPIKPKEPAIRFLESRGISEEIAKRYQITCQTDSPNVLCMPFIDDKGNWVTVKYRKTDFDKNRDSCKEWSEKDCKPILYGMAQCNPENKTLIITEGQLDSLSVAEAGIENAVSVPTGAKGFTWIPYCWDFVNRHERLVVFGDYEKGEITLLSELQKRFDMIAVYHVRPEDYKDCKDANEILQKYGKEQVRQCIANAIQDAPEYLLDISDVEQVNIYDIEKVPTGINSLDRLLYGGLPFPGLTILSGKRGEGKSTLAGQILSTAIDHDYKCLAYSGELAAWHFKAWLFKQIAGGNHTFLYQNKSGDQGYAVSKTNENLINAWIRDKLYLIDNTRIVGSESVGLISAIETAIKRYGVRLILLDNLMTAISMLTDAGSDKNAIQEDFVNKLAQIAMTYNVHVIIVAHKRKNAYGGDGMDDVLGASAITNLANIVITYGRDRELGEDQRLLQLWKNRDFGKVNFKGWTMDFDERSNRIYGIGDDKEKEFGWVKDNEANMAEYQWSTDLPEDLPFND